MRVEVDPRQCCAYRICVEISPNVYQVNSLGKAEGLFEVVPDEFIEEALEGARECPAGAIKIHGAPQR